MEQRMLSMPGIQSCHLSIIQFCLSPGLHSLTRNYTQLMATPALQTRPKAPERVKMQRQRGL